MVKLDGKRANAGTVCCVVCCLALGMLLASCNVEKRQAAPAAAPAPTIATPVYECRWTAEPITIDGKGDEAAWKQAQVIDRFYLPGQGGKLGRTATKARLLWDHDYLYFLAEMEDADLYANVTEHDGPAWDNDVFELFLKPSEKNPGYYEFEVNAANTTLDMFLYSRGSGGYNRYKATDEFDFQTAVQLRGTLNDPRDRDQGWTVEGRLRWRDFAHTGGAPAVGDRWKFALCRYDYSVDFEGPELTCAAPLTRSDFHHYEDYATLKFVGQ
jgi:hypothetical protein